MHPVVQDWCIRLARRDEIVVSSQLNKVALISVGYTVPSERDRNHSKLQQRLIPHANYVRRGGWTDTDIAVRGEFEGLGNLYSDRGKVGFQKCPWALCFLLPTVSKKHLRNVMKPVF
jgi:hypothetical protein